MTFRMRLAAAVAFAVIGTAGVVVVTGDVVYPVVFASTAAALLFLWFWLTVSGTSDRLARTATATPRRRAFVAASCLALAVFHGVFGFVMHSVVQLGLGVLWLCVSVVQVRLNRLVGRARW